MNNRGSAKKLRRGKLARFLLVFLLAISWLYSGWPYISQNPRFPQTPYYAEAAAATSTSLLSGYRWFSNVDSTQIGSPLAATNTEATAPAQGTAFRLRVLLHESSTINAINLEPKNVDTPNDVGQYTAIAAPTTSTVYISYFNNTTNDLFFATSTDSGITFSTSSVDTVGIVGQYTAIAAPTTSTVYISYYDSTNSAFKIATSSNGGGSWSTKQVDRTSAGTGQYGSIAVPAGSPSTIYMSYNDGSTAANKGGLRFGKSTNSGVTITTSSVDSSGGSANGQYTSITSPTSTYIFISYYDSTPQDIKFSKSSDSGTSWATSTIDSAGNIGQYTSIIAPTTSTIYISYYDVTNGDLKFAKSTDGGTTFATSSVDATGDVGSYDSITSVGTSTIFISYYDATNKALKVARSTDGGSTWTTSQIDSGTGTLIGTYTSLEALDQNNIFASYYDGQLGNLNLKFAKLTSFKLQVAQMSGTCDTGFVGESYSDVATSSGVIRFYDNPATADGATLTTSSTDPVHGSDAVTAQKYVESNPFTTVSSVATSTDMEFDLSLVDNSAPAGTSYCFRVVRADANSTALDQYDIIPKITTNNPTSTITQAGFRLYNNDDSLDTDAVASRPSASNANVANAVVVDATNSVFYAVGYDGNVASGSAKQWRVEKRNFSDGALVYATTSRPDSSEDAASAVALDASAMYIAGYDSGVPAFGASHGRIEKRTTSSGSLSWSTSTADSAATTLNSIAVDPANNVLYAAGYDLVSASFEFHIEKRNTSDGSFVSTFGSSGILREDVSTSSDVVNAIVYDASTSAIYVGGYDGNGVDEWRIERRAAATGTLVWTATSNPSIGSDRLQSLAVDSANGFLYAAGYDSGGAGSKKEWRLEKHNLSDGSLVYATTTDPSAGDDVINGIAIDSSNMYVAGYDTNGKQEWRVEKRSLSTGATSSIVTSTLATATSSANGIGIDTSSSNIYVAGSDRYYGNSNDEWRMEKRSTASGLSLQWGPLAAQNTSSTLASTGANFRLRVLLSVASADVATSSRTFKLQYAVQQSGSCGTASTATSTYTDVGTSTGAFQFYDNPSPSDGTALIANVDDPTDGSNTIVKEAYVESNASFTIPTAIPAGQDGLWDFSLVDNSATSATPFCFRVTNSNGSDLNTYSVFPALNTASAALSQVGYRFYQNSGALYSGSPMAATNTMATLAQSGDTFRIRILLHASGVVATSAQSFELMSGKAATSTCTGSEIASQIWTALSSFNFNDNTGVTGGTRITASSTDPVHGSDTIVPETYEDDDVGSNPLTFSNQYYIPSGQDGEWDFSLKDSGANSAGVYCFAIRKSDGSALSQYTQVAALRIPDASSTQSAYRWYNNTDSDDLTAVRDLPSGEYTAFIPHGIAVDSTYAYVVGEAASSSQNWRIEKRSLATTSLDTNFGTAGVITVRQGKVAYGVVSDGTSLYVSGTDTTYGWRIEKRLISTGALDGTFGVSGVATSTSGSSTALVAIARDSNYLYLAGTDTTNHWRIEKRSTSTGALSYAVASAATTSPQAIAIDSANMYVVGSATTGTAASWRIEKRLLADGSLVAAFGSGGVVTGSSSSNIAYGVAADASYVYVVGDTTSSSWRIEKRSVSSGSGDPSFGNGGIVTDTGLWTGGSAQTAYGIAIDSSYMYIAGLGSQNLFLEKRLLSTGATSTGFTHGNQSVDTTNGGNVLTGMAVASDTSNFYVVSNQSNKWRVDARKLSDGTPGWGTPLAALNTSTTAPAQGLPFRLRTLIHSAANKFQNNLKLQYAVRGALCDTAFQSTASSSYADVGTSTGNIRFSTNSSVAATTTAMKNSTYDPTHGSDTNTMEQYASTNPFVIVTAVPVGQDGVWDLSLVDYSAPAGTHYCFRLVNSSGTLLTAYSVIPEIQATDVPGAPGTPTFSNVQSSTLTASWTSGSGATYYALERAPNSGGSPGTFSQITTTTALTYNDAGLSVQTTYWYRVRGVNAKGNGLYSGNASTTTGGGYAPSGSLTSDIIDTTITNGVAPNSFYWEGTQPANTTVKFQFAAATSSAGPWTYKGWSAATGCDTSQYYLPDGPSVPIEIKALCFNNLRYLRYKIYLSTTAPSSTPQVDRVILNYAR